MRGNGAASPRDGAAPGLSRYAQVANDLMERIAAGEYPVGSLVSKEVDLSAEYGISRHTMREALRRLDEAGLVSRRLRAGTEVVALAPSAMIESIYGLTITDTDQSLQAISLDKATAKRLRVLPVSPALRLFAATTTRTTESSNSRLPFILASGLST